MPFPLQKPGKADEVWPPWSDLIWNVSGQHVGLCSTSPKPGTAPNPPAAYPGRSALSTRHTGRQRGDPWGSRAVALPVPASRGNPVEQHTEMWLGNGRARGRHVARCLLGMLSMLHACGGDVYQRGTDSRRACLQWDEPGSGLRKGYASATSANTPYGSAVLPPPWSRGKESKKVRPQHGGTGG